MEQTQYCLEADLSSAIYLKEDNLLGADPHFHDSMEFIFIKRGSAVCHLDNKSMTLGQGDIFFVESYQTHYYESTGDILAYVLVLSRDYTQTFRTLYPGLTFEAYLTDKEKNKAIFELMNHWVFSDNKTELYNQGQASILLSLLINKYNLVHREEYQGDILLKELLRYIHQHYLEDITVISMAHDLGYTPEYCSKTLKKCLKNGVRSYINSLRIKRANELLSDKSLNLSQSEVLYQCGFSSPSTYYRVKKELEEDK